MSMKVRKMKNYKRYLLENIIFTLGEIKFMIYHLRTLDLNDEYRNKLNKIENDINDLMQDLTIKENYSLFDQVFQGDEKR
jgi:hypothetical protein